MATKTTSLPEDLAAAKRRIDKWRSLSRTRRPIPEELWEMAIALVPVHGVHRVSRTLRLRYDKVKAALKARPSKSKVRSKPTFVQVAAPTLAMPSSPGEVTVEVTDKHGNHMCIRCPAAVDAARLIAVFCGGGGT